MLVVDNIKDGETVHQRCLLVLGRESTPQLTDGTISVTTKDGSGQATFPEQRWPLCGGYFKALLILNTGENHIALRTVGEPNGVAETSVEFSFKLNYVPLLQTPPLHLAILVAKDSPLQIDCPPAKYGHVTSTHSDIEAAIAKFRLFAYMSQALTAEDLRAKGLGRRAFRLEEEWGLDTLSKVHQDAKHEDALHDSMRSTAKIHVIRTEHTVAELRDMQKAQQNPSGRNRNELHEIFSCALKKYGGVFTSSAHPIVAGLILDSHYSVEKNLILGHAALGAHDSKGLSLGIFGSHLCYSWPRFFEEITNCLLDTSPPGDTVGNDNGECLSMWEACAVGQGAFLHEIGHALSAPHTTGIMARGYAQNWPKCFLSCTSYSAAKKTAGIAVVTPETLNDCQWDLRDALRFANLPHLRLPSDTKWDAKIISKAPEVQLLDDEDFLRLSVTAEAGIAQVFLNGKLEGEASVSNPIKSIQYTADELEGRFSRDKPLKMELLAMNGKHEEVDVWKLFSSLSYIRVPGTSIRLMKKSANATRKDKPNLWEWAVMLKKARKDGTLVSASKIDIRVGCSLDGAIVYYKDGTHIPCGPRWNPGDRSRKQEPHMGGHQARKLALPTSADIVKVQVCHIGKLDSSNYCNLSGLRMHLSNGKAMGALNNGNKAYKVVSLEPEAGQKIVGFYGTSGIHGMCNQFGIITAPQDQELPVSVYSMPELQNPVGQTSSNGGSKGKHEAEAEADDDETDTSEDEDGGYDHDIQDSVTEDDDEGHDY